VKTETCKLYSRDFWIFLPNIIKIDPYNFELYRFKVGLFFRHSVVNVAACDDSVIMVMIGLMTCDDVWQHSPSEGACCTSDCRLISQYSAHVCRQDTSCQTASFCEYPLRYVGYTLTNSTFCAYFYSQNTKQNWGVIQQNSLDLSCKLFSGVSLVALSVFGISGANRLGRWRLSVKQCVCGSQTAINITQLG